jgi:hypothetical protein
LDLVEAAPLERLKALSELLADTRRGRLRQLPEPRLLAQRLDIPHRQSSHERADHHRPQRLGAQQLAAAREQLRDERFGGLADLRNIDLDLSLARLHPAGAKPVAQPRPIVAQPALILGPALVASATQPRVELILHSTLDDQARAELRQHRQGLPRVLTDPNSQQLIDLIFNLRRRRYGTSHGVGLLQSSCRT